MKIAALYDIHGNLIALQSVLSELESLSPDLIVIGGDVLPGPQPSQCLSAIQTCPWPTACLMGNGERDVLAILHGNSPNAPQQYWGVLKWVAEELSPDQVDWIQAWPKTISILHDSMQSLLFCHATPDSLDSVFTAVTPESRLLQTFESAAEKLIVCGHTHMQFDRRIGTKRIVNAGSVGMSYGVAGAAWLWIDKHPELQVTDYDTSIARDTITQTAFPGADQFIANHVLTIPDRTVMQELFEKAAAKFFPALP